jgi:hypothetical protein
MDLRAGYQIEDPDVFVRWGITEVQLQALLPAAVHVTTGYFAIDCISLSGLSHALGFHFYPSRNGVLYELRLFRRSSSRVDLAESFHEFQEHLEATLGPPMRRSAAVEGFARYGWQFGDVSVRHLVFDREIPEERVRITRS